MFKENTKWFSVLLVICTLLGGLGGYGYGFIFNPKAPVTNFLMDINGNLDVNSIETNTARIDALTSGRIPIAGANGLLGDSSNLRWTNGNTLNAPIINATSSLYVNGEKYYPESEASYVVWVDGVTYYAKNGHTGALTSYVNGALAITAAIAGLTPGRTWVETIILKGNLGSINSVTLASYTRILGYNAVLHLANPNTIIFNIPQSLTTITRAIIENIEFVDDWAGNGYAINLSYFNGAWAHPEVNIIKCRFNAFNVGIYGLLYNSEISSNYFIGNTVNTIYFIGGSKVTINNNQFNSLVEGQNSVRLLDVQYTIISNNVFTGAKGGATLPSYGLALQSDWFSNIYGNHFINFNQAGIITDNLSNRQCKDMNIYGNVFYNNGGVGKDPGYASAQIVIGSDYANSPSDNINIYGNTACVGGPTFIQVGSESWVGLNIANTAIDIHNNVIEDQYRPFSINGNNYVISIKNNRFHNTHATHAAVIGTGTLTISGNIGFVTENSGTAGSITLGTTHQHITHGLSYTPTAANIGITWTTSLTNCTSWAVTGISSTEFVVNLYDATGAAKGPSGTVTYSWKVIKTP